MTEPSPESTNPQADRVIFQLTTGTIARALAWIRSVLGWLTLG